MKTLRYALLALVLAAAALAPAEASAGEKQGRLSIGTALMYENGWEATIAYDREGRYHSGWEFFADGYLKWRKCPTCRHVCAKSLFDNYRTWDIGAAWKPCVGRWRNRHGNLRIGAAVGSDTRHVIGVFHLGYQQTYNLRGGWALFWTAKTEICIKARDTFRTGIGIGIKIPR